MGSAAGASEVDLLARLAAGEQEALGTVYDRHARPSWSLARRICRDPGFAEDAVQEAFLALWRDPARDDPHQASLGTWLLTLVHHKSVDLVRREDAWRRRRDQPPIRPDPGVEEAAISAVVAGQVRDALRRLPAAQRQMLMLAYYDGYTQREIAQLTGVPLGTVKARTVTGLQRLKVALARPAGHLPEREN